MKKIRDFCRSKPSAAAGAAVVLLLILVAVFADALAPVKMEAGTLPSNILYKLEGPYWTLSETKQALQASSGTIYWLGTDNLGRDVLSYLIYGARTSVILCLGVSVLTTLIAVVIGTLSAVIGGWFDLIVQRFVDAFTCIPGMLLSMILMAMIGNGMWQLVLVMSIPGGIGQSRLIRSAVLAVKDAGYCRSSDVLGGGRGWKMLHHVVPNIMPIIIVTAAGGLGGTVMMEASMNFLGYGVKVGTPSWGYMITNQGRANMYSAPQLCLYPGICIAVMVLAANLFGDGLRDYLDPKLQGGVGSYDTKKIRKIAAKHRKAFEDSQASA